MGIVNFFKMAKYLNQQAVRDRLAEIEAGKNTYANDENVAKLVEMATDLHTVASNLDGIKTKHDNDSFSVLRTAFYIEMAKLTEAQKEAAEIFDFYLTHTKKDSSTLGQQIQELNDKIVAKHIDYYSQVLAAETGAKKETPQTVAVAPQTVAAAPQTAELKK